jgi:hypothetical protein
MQHIPLKNRHQIEFTSLDNLIEKENKKFRGMKRIWTRGIENANKCMLGAAIAYNLKKWINFKVKKVNVKLEVLAKPLKKDNLALQNIFIPKADM